LRIIRLVLRSNFVVVFVYAVGVMIRDGLPNRTITADSFIAMMACIISGALLVSVSRYTV
jgi:acyl-CoA synthetase (AMP-forming)/AMP-acid ligase II